IVYNTMILAFKQGVKVILTLPTVLHRVIEKTSHLIRKNRKDNPSLFKTIAISKSNVKIRSYGYILEYCACV
ncbi:MAG: hypothetical protein ABIH71_06615, partial [Candidatus Omnitrophota bacterium]